MTQVQITNGNSAVAITGDDGFFSARLYVNARDGLANASATMIAGSFKTLAGARRWADRKLAA